jgi:anti-anti-sigma factor
METGNVFYAKHEDLLVLKFVGEIRYTMGDSYRISASLDSFLDKLFRDQDFKNVLIDLTETESIDSTNLGLLARIARYSLDTLDSRPTIISTNEDINAILDSVGFDRIFTIIHDPEHPEVELQQMPEVEEPDRELAQMLLEAHKNLTALNERNRDMFKNVVELLERRVHGEEQKPE